MTINITLFPCFWTFRKIILFAESAKLRALRALIPHMLCALRALVPCVPRALRALLCSTCSHVSYALRVLELLVSRTLRALVLLVSHLLQVFQAKRTLMPLISCSFHALCLLYVCCFSYLCCLQSGLRLIIVIDNNKDTFNINDINTLYPLRVALHVKNEFRDLQKWFKSNQRGFGYVWVLSLKFESGRGDRDDSELFYRTTLSILFCLKTSLQFKVI